MIKKKKYPNLHEIFHYLPQHKFKENFQLKGAEIISFMFVLTILLVIKSDTNFHKSRIK